MTWGEKFACRTMVDYIFPDEETARLSNVKDPMGEMHPDTEGTRKGLLSEPLRHVQALESSLLVGRQGLVQKWLVEKGPP